MLEISQIGTLLRLIVKGEYRDREWADRFGEVQNALRRKKYGSSTITTFIVDLSDCIWADPIPLLATLLVGIEFRLAKEDVDVYIPCGDEQNSTSDRFAKFLAQEGFLGQCVNWNFNIYNSRQEPIDRAEIAKLASIGVDLAYQNALCIPAELLSLSSGSFSVEKLCERLTALPSFDLVLGERVPAWARERVKYKVYQVLFETMSNVYEHAYEEGRQKLCGIYVRYRSGLLGLPQDQQAISEKQLQLEHHNCPRLDREFLDTCFGAFEVFVVDSGRGLVKSLLESDGAIPDPEMTGKYPFQWMSQYVFGKPIAKRKKSKATEYGGLYLIHKLLSADRDYVRGLDDRTWIGDFVPAKGQPQHILAGQVYNGLVWHFRLGWNDKTDIGDKWQVVDSAIRVEVLEALCDDNTLREKTKDWWYLDQRFTFEQDYARGVFVKEKEVSLPRNIIWYVPPKLTKTDIYSKLDRQVLAGGEGEGWAYGEGGRTLFIVDIPVHEAETYIAAFDNAEVNVREHAWVKKIDIVVLLSRHLANCRLQAVPYCTDPDRTIVKFVRSNECYGRSLSVTTVGALTIKGPFSPRTNFRDLLRWIKWHDSERFWVALSSQKDDLSYIPDKISWGVDSNGNTTTLKGYLDFSQALANPLCRALLRVVASRLPGLIEVANVQLMPLDSMASTLADDLYWTDSAFALHDSSALKPQQQPPSIALGSVIVTGSTERAIVTTQDQLVVHFFKHPQSTADQRPHLLYWPKQDNDWFKNLFITSGLKELKRIGSTAAIAERGWKYFELPRYDAQGRILAGRSPRETYADWQKTSPVILKTGHWVYGSQHDLVSVNLALALQESFHRDSDMGCFILFNLFRLLGVNRELLNDEGQVWWRRVFDTENGWLRRMQDHHSPSQHTVDEVAVVVYPSHHNTELIVEKFLSLISPDHVITIRSRLLPIRGVRGRHGGSANLMLPLTLVRLERVLAHQKLVTVAYLDDAIISGRTLRESCNLIDEHGGVLDQAIVLLDRQRMPAENRAENVRVRHFWRLDVPLMGSEGSCPLCNAVTMAQAFVGALASQRTKTRVSDIIESWKGVSPSFDWARGLHPVPLGFSVEKRFSLRSGISLGEPILLTRSTGLAVWVSELHAMTCEDALASSVSNYGLNKHMRGSKPVPTDALVEMLATQILLFGEEYSNEDIQELLLRIFETSIELKGNGSHTSLALLVLIAKSNDLIRTARIHWQRQMANIAHRFAEMPEDLQIAIAFFLHIGILSNKDIRYREAERLLSSRSSHVANKYSQLNYEIFDYDGNQHSGPLSRIAQWGPKFSLHGLMLGLNSIDKLRDLVAELETQSAFPPEERPGGFPAIRLEFKEALSEAARLIEAELENIDQPPNALMRNQGVINAAEKVLELGKRFHACFFVDIRLDQFSHRYFEERTLTSLFESAGLMRSGASNLFAFSRCLQPEDFSRLGKKCVCWDHEIVRVITDLATNAKDSLLIADPWFKNENMASLWVRVDYHNENVVVKLANATETPAAEIKSRLHGRARPRWEHIYAIGGRVSGPYQHESHNDVVVMEVQIPFAGFLVADRYLKELESY